MQKRLMSKAEIVQGLRLLRQRGFPMTIVAALAGVSRIAIWRARQGEISDAMQQLLSPIVSDALNGQIKAAKAGLSKQWYVTVDSCYA